MLRVRIKLRSSQYAAPLRTLMRRTGRQEFTQALPYERYGLPDMDVYKSRLEGRNMRLSPQAVETLRRGFNGVRGGFWREMVEVSRLGTAKRSIFCRNVQQNTARIDCIAMNVVICRTFSRAVFCWLSTADGDTALWIERLKMSHFAGLSPPR
jgi:hypothetical protein